MSIADQTNTSLNCLSVPLSALSVCLVALHSHRRRPQPPHSFMKTAGVRCVRPERTSAGGRGRKVGGGAELWQNVVSLSSIHYSFIPNPSIHLRSRSVVLQTAFFSSSPSSSSSISPTLLFPSSGFTFLSRSLSLSVFFFSCFFFSPPSFFREERGRVASCHGNSKLLRATCLLVCRARVKERWRGVSLPPCFSHPPQNLRETPQKRQLIVMIRNVRLPQSTADTAPLFRN